MRWAGASTYERGLPCISRRFRCNRRSRRGSSYDHRAFYVLHPDQRRGDSNASPRAPPPRPPLHAANGCSILANSTTSSQRPQPSLGGHFARLSQQAIASQPLRPRPRPRPLPQSSTSERDATPSIHLPPRRRLALTTAHPLGRHIAPRTLNAASGAPFYVPGTLAIGGDGDYQRAAGLETRGPRRGRGVPVPAPRQPARRSHLLRRPPAHLPAPPNTPAATASRKPPP